MTSLTPRVHDQDGSRIVAYDFGAHLAEWSVDAEPVVWLSERAVLDGSAPVRGGVPICFPWFAAGPTGDLSPSHGLARTVPWRPADPGDGAVWAWELDAGALEGRPGAEHLPGPFRLRYAVSLTPGPGAEDLPALTLALTVTNPADRPLRAEAALHTYLAVDDVERTRVLGLDGVGYRDKVREERRVQHGPVDFRGETDRVYDSPGDRPGVVVADGRRELHLRPEGATQTVVWNPGAEKAAGLDDLPDSAWRRFVCVETAATAARALAVPPGASTRLACTITVHPPTTA